MMKFRPIPIEGSETHVYILPAGQLPGNKQPTPRHPDITRIEVENCPVKKPCVTINNNYVTELCKHMGVYPDNVNGELVFESLPCSHPEAPTNRLAVTSVTRFAKCEFHPERKACVDQDGACEHLQGIIQAPGIDHLRPRFEITCVKLRQKIDSQP